MQVTEATEIQKRFSFLYLPVHKNLLGTHHQSHKHGDNNPDKHINRKIHIPTEDISGSGGLITCETGKPGSDQCQ